MAERVSADAREAVVVGGQAPPGRPDATGDAADRRVPALHYTLLAVTFSVIWAAAIVAVKTLVTYAPPLLAMAIRFLAAGGLLLGFARLRGLALPVTWADWRPIVVLGLLTNALYLGLSALALTALSSGTVAILASTNPLILAVVAPWLLHEPLTVWKAAGLLTGFGGVVWVMGSRVGEHDQPWAMAVTILAIVFLVAGNVFFKRTRFRQDLLVVNGGQLLAAGLLLAVPSLLWESAAAVRWTPAFLAALAFVVLVTSCLGTLIWFWLLRHGDASRASAYFFLNPVVGLFLGALLLGEPLRPQDFAGAGAVALGIYLVQRG